MKNYTNSSKQVSQDIYAIFIHKFMQLKFDSNKSHEIVAL